jgi:glutathione synthase/RimK-type ligase-like ATP-grasp enzyme
MLQPLLDRLRRAGEAIRQRMTIKVFTWLWRQTPQRHGFDVDKVNTWAKRFREHCTLDVELACVTDQPAGLAADVEAIPLPADFPTVDVRAWRERSGMPQCLRRLDLFRHDAAERYGADWLVSMDLDVTFHGAANSLDSLFAVGPQTPPLHLYGATCSRSHYNGGLVMLRAGSRTDIFDGFMADPAGVASAAREKFIGSDQAVLSHLLGPAAVPTWTAAEGVFHFSPRFLREHAGGQSGPPPSLRMLFFPGNVKPWTREAGMWPWVAAAWGGVPFRPKRQRVRLRAYDDPKRWGKQFASAARKRGHLVTMFPRARAMPGGGTAFVRLDQQGPERERSKRVVEDLSRLGIRTLPRLEEARWYDDKGAQLAPLAKWLPRTTLIHDRAAALALLDTGEWQPPFVSKAIDGSASKTVRLIASVDAARSEVARAFSVAGIPSVYDRRQQGYVYWQELVPACRCDYRVCVVGDYLYGLVRDVRPGDFRASGSGVHRPLIAGSDREVAALNLARTVADELGTNWLAFDIVFGPCSVAPSGGCGTCRDCRGYVLELSSAWTMEAYAECPLYRRADLAATSRTGRDSFDIAVEIAEKMA